MKLTIKEYMNKYRIKSKQTVYNKIKAGEIKKVKEGTRIFIVVKEEKPGIDQEINSELQELLKEIKQDREQSEAYIKELKEHENEAQIERTGIFGISEITKIYDNLLTLIKELISLDYFEYEIKQSKKKQ